MNHTILFTGHMIDAADRANPRFPAYKENAVKEEIRKKLLNAKEKIKDELIGIAGGACGGDILFHESCIELDIPSEMYLALPVEEFIKTSVSFAGNDWTIRFNKLKEKLRVHILKKVEDNRETVWERSNSWMLILALKNSGENMTLIALWDGKGGDGAGGTEHMVKISKEQGANVEIIYINQV